MGEKDSSGLQKKVVLSIKRETGKNEALCSYAGRFCEVGATKNPGKITHKCGFSHYPDERCVYETNDLHVGCRYFRINLVNYNLSLIRSL